MWIFCVLNSVTKCKPFKDASYSEILKMNDKKEKAPIFNLYWRSYTVCMAVRERDC